METSKETKIVHIGISGEGNSLWKIISKRMAEYIERYEYQAMLQACGVKESDLNIMEDQTIIMSEKIKQLSESIQLLQGVGSNEPTIEQLKKQIKYSKNPLEVKMLNRQLNQIYKDQKGVKYGK